jgi:hypothetical protein
MLPPPDVVRAILERGARAKALLDLPAFQEFVDDLTNQHITEMLAAPPGERGREARDDAHLRQYAVTELVATVKLHADAADELSRVLDLDAEEESDE